MGLIGGAWSNRGNCRGLIGWELPRALSEASGCGSDRKRAAADESCAGGDRIRARARARSRINLEWFGTAKHGRRFGTVKVNWNGSARQSVEWFGTVKCELGLRCIRVEGCAVCRNNVTGALGDEERTGWTSCALGAW